MTAADVVARLKARFLADAARLPNGAPDKAEPLFAGIATAYGEPHRAYHTLDHLAFLFARLDEHAAGAQDPLRLAFAGWYHDIVYDPSSQTNEAMSAVRAADDLEALGADTDVIERVCRLIRATGGPVKGTLDKGDRLFLDADYSIVGADPEIYARYVAGVRFEYRALTDEAWRNGRGTFLKSVLARPRIFATDTFDTAYGESARRNITAELAKLGA